jgi:cell wall-associated NlpC family hydrolase
MMLAFSPIAAATATSVLAAPLDTPIPQPGATPNTAATPGTVASAIANGVASIPAPQPTPGTELADFAEQYVGSPYRWGGASPSGFDCTGFVMWVYSQFGVSLPHNEAGQLASGDRVSADELKPGDVLVFANTYRAGLSHTGIYLGDGQFVHAADERHGVTVSALWDSYWGPRLVGATRAIS